MGRSARRAACASHIGGRSEQQDRTVCLASPDGGYYLLVVADGMGGHQGGELAASAVIEVAAELWRAHREAPAAPTAFLEALCQQAHARILSRGLAQGIAPHSTIAALLVTPQRAWWAHVGDSRIYVFRHRALLFRTEDHTLMQQLIRSGQLLEAESLVHPDRHKLLRGLGGDEPVRPTHGQMAIDADTGFLLCTDGFWASVHADEMPALLRPGDAAEACAQWAATAAARGGAEGDNVSVAVLTPAPPAGFDHRRLWPLYGALAVALAVAVARLFH